MVLRAPGWIPTIATVAGLALTLSAAHWQFGRAQYKVGLQREYLARQAQPAIDLAKDIPSAGEAQHRKVHVAGVLLSDKAIFLDNRIRKGRAGYEYLVPLQIGETGKIVLINRGWIPRGQKRDELPKLIESVGPVSLTGYAVVPGPAALELSDRTIEGRVWQNLTLDRFREKQHLDVVDFIIQEQSELDDGFIRDWPAPGFGVQTHQSYAVQWLIFAGLILFFYVYYGFIRNKPTSKE